MRGPDGVLAGSVLTMIEAVQNLHALGVPLAEAVGAATAVPARDPRAAGGRPAGRRPAGGHRDPRRQRRDRPRARRRRRACGCRVERSSPRASPPPPSQPRSRGSAERRPAAGAARRPVDHDRHGRPRAERALLARIRAGQVGGVILFARNVGTHGRAHAADRVAPGRGGRGRQPAAADRGRPGRRRGEAAAGRAARPLARPRWGATGAPPRRDAQGFATAAYLRRLGIDLDLAPVLDTPASPSSFLGSRAFSRDPRLNAALGTAFVRRPAARRRGGDREALPGARDGARCRPTRTTSLLDDAARRARAPPRAVRPRDRRGREGRHGQQRRLPAYDPTAVPAVISRPIVTGLLRERLGFRGVVISDAMEAPGPSGRPHAAVVRDRRRRRRPALRRRGHERRRATPSGRRGEERRAAAERAAEVGGADRGAQALARPALRSDPKENARSPPRRGDRMRHLRRPRIQEGALDEAFRPHRRGMTSVTTDRVTVPRAEDADVLTDDAVAFLADLHRTFESRRRELLDARRAARGHVPQRRAAGVPAVDRRRARRRLAGRAGAGRDRRPPRRDHRAGRSQDGDQRAQLGRQGVHGRLRGRDLADVGQPAAGPAEPHRGARPHALARHGREELPPERRGRRAVHAPARVAPGRAPLRRRRRADLGVALRLRPLLLPQPRARTGATSTCPSSSRTSRRGSGTTSSPGPRSGSTWSRGRSGRPS